MLTSDPDVQRMLDQTETITIAGRALCHVTLVDLEYRRWPNSSISLRPSASSTAPRAAWPRPISRYRFWAGMDICGNTGSSRSCAMLPKRIDTDKLRYGAATRNVVPGVEPFTQVV